MPDKHKKKDSSQEANPMPAEAFREWRRRLGLKQKEAADLLGLKKRMIQYYETGSRGGNEVSIPKSIRLACYALEAGVSDYDGKQVVGDTPWVGLRLVRNAHDFGVNGSSPNPSSPAYNAPTNPVPPPLPARSGEE